MIWQALTELATVVETETGVKTTLDPAAVNPPVIVIDPPEISAATQGGYTMTVPVTLVGISPADAKNTQALLDTVPALLTACGENATSPTTYTTTQNTTYPAYRVLTTLTVRRTQ
mgnify:CR=1 FL=1